MTPDFEVMTVAELRAYAIAHRDDLTALRTLFSHRDATVSRRNFPNTEEGQAQMMQFLEEVAQAEGKIGPQ
jgi:hypothetical protein